MQRRSISRYAIGKRGRERERERDEKGGKESGDQLFASQRSQTFLRRNARTRFLLFHGGLLGFLDLWTNNCLVSFFAILLQFIRWDKNLWREEEKKMIPWLNIWIVISINTSCTKFNIDFSYPKYISQLLVIYLYTIILMEFILRCLVYTRFLLHEFLLLI